MLRLIRQFMTESASRLGAQLSDFENNVRTETADIRLTFQPALVQQSFTSATANTRTLLTAQIAVCDTDAGGFSISLAAPVGLTPGLLGLVKRQAAGTVTLLATGQSAPGVARTINGASSKAYAATGLSLVYFDGLNWWG